MRFFLTFLCLCLLSTPTSYAQAQDNKLHVAVASNFAGPAREIASAFEKKTNHRVILSFGSTGKLYVQIKNGAPFSVFLSADEDRPMRLEEEGLAVKGTRRTYALGRLVLFSMYPGKLKNGPEILQHPNRFKRLAIANPLTAPYGVAARQTLQSLKAENIARNQIVHGENIAQTFQFVRTRNAQLGFVSASQVRDLPNDLTWMVPASMHAPIRQDAQLLASHANNATAQQFLSFLYSDQAKRIIKTWGYDVITR